MWLFSGHQALKGWINRNDDGDDNDDDNDCELFCVMVIYESQEVSLVQAMADLD